MNQWHVIADGYVLVTGTEWTKLYFLAFHIVNVICIMNIFIAFVLEAFILEYSLSDVRIRSRLLAKINGLGLLISSRTKKLDGRVTDDHQPISVVTHHGDADHENWWEEELGSAPASAADGSGANSTTVSYRDFSTRTSIRFYLRRRAASVQDMLEKMFDKPL